MPQSGAVDADHGWNFVLAPKPFPPNENSLTGLGKCQMTKQPHQLSPSLSPVSPTLNSPVKRRIRRDETCARMAACGRDSACGAIRTSQSRHRISRRHEDLLADGIVQLGWAVTSRRVVADEKKLPAAVAMRRV